MDEQINGRWIYFWFGVGNFGNLLAIVQNSEFCTLVDIFQFAKFPPRFWEYNGGDIYQFSVVGGDGSI